MEQELQFAKAIAQQAGVMMLKNFGKDHSYETKDDRTPVTAIDKAINDLLIKQVQTNYSDHGVLGEEASWGSGQEKYQWLCDPIDGTVPYMLAIPASIFMVALLENGVPVMSLLYNPYTNEMFHAIKNKGAFCNDEQINVNDAHFEDGYVLLGTTAFPYVDAIKQHGGKVQPVPATGYKCISVARGKAIAVIKHTSDFHDVGPASLLIEEAGGKVTDLSGNNVDRYDRPIGGTLLSNGACHEKLVSIVTTHFLSNSN